MECTPEELQATYAEAVARIAALEQWKQVTLAAVYRLQSDLRKSAQGHNEEGTAWVAHRVMADAVQLLTQYWPDACVLTLDSYPERVEAFRKQILSRLEEAACDPRIVAHEDGEPRTSGLFGMSLVLSTFKSARVI